MIIACPACNTRYVVPDDAIGDTGRTVRCAKCKHSWHQSPPESLDLTDLAQSDTPTQTKPAPPPEPAPSPATRPAPVPPAGIPPETDLNDAGDDTAGPSVNHWRTEDHPAAETAARAFRQSRMPDSTSEFADSSEKGDEEDPDAAPATPSSSDLSEQPSRSGASSDDPADYSTDDYSDSADAYDDDDYSGAEYDADEDESQFEYRPPFTRRRNPLKMWTIAAVAFFLLASSTVFAVSYYGLPSWLPFDRPTFGATQSSLDVVFPEEDQERRTSPSGTEYFEANGTITNIGRETVAVPSILMVLRDERERIVYDWQIQPPVSELAPGESVTISEAKTDVPRSAVYLDYGWSPN